MGMLHDASAVILDMECLATPRYRCVRLPRRDHVDRVCVGSFSEALQHTGMRECNMSLQRMLEKKAELLPLLQCRDITREPHPLAQFVPQMSSLGWR